MSAAIVSKKSVGFTLMELMVVLAIIGLLLSVAVPHYFGALDRSKESILRHDLVTMRDAIDKFYGDNGRYPDDLAELVKRKYLRQVPADPITDSSETWQIITPPDSAKGNLFDIKSGAQGTAADGTAYSEW